MLPPSLLIDDAEECNLNSKDGLHKRMLCQQRYFIHSG